MKRIYLHALPLRIWHWLHALMVIILLITGMQLRISGISSLRPHDPALVLHKYAGWGMVGLYVFWFAYSIVSRNLSTNYAMGRQSLRGIFTQAKFYGYTLFQGAENPFMPKPDNKFNPLQKIAYGSTMFVFAPVIIITGLFYMDIDILRKYMLLWKIADVVSAVHIAAAYVFALFLVVHVYMATLGPTPFSHIRAMIRGYEEAHSDEIDPGDPGVESGSRNAEKLQEIHLATGKEMP